MKFFVKDSTLFVQVHDRTPVPVMPFDQANPPDHDELLQKLEVVVNQEYAAAVGDAFRRSLLGIARDISPE